MTEAAAAALIASYHEALTRSPTVTLARQRINADMRACRWSNQTADARKWRADDGGPPFPWVGASDMRVPLVDHYVNVQVAFAVAAEARRQTSVIPLHPDQAPKAANLGAILAWLKTTQMPERPWEVRLLANYLYETGKAVMATVWRQRWQYDTDQLDLEHLHNLAAQQRQVGNGGPETVERIVTELPAAIQDPDRTDEAVAGIRLLYEDLTASSAKRVVDDLRRQGFAEFPRPYLGENRPLSVALCPGLDIILPPDTTTIQEARVVFWRELMPEWKIRSLARAAGWDERWLSEVIERKGEMSTGLQPLFVRDGRSVSGTDQTSELYEIVHCYERSADQRGVEGIYYSVMNPATPGVGFHELLDYDHGDMPFIEFRTEQYSRLFAESRGVGEVIGPFQQVLKRTFDWSIDRASIATIPPWYYPHGQKPAAWAPGVGIETTNPEQYGFLKPPTPDAGVDKVALDARAFADDYIGIQRPDHGNRMEATALRQEQIDKFLLGMAGVDRQILQLAQQFLPPTISYAVIGPSASGQPVHLDREEIQGQFNVAVAMDVRLFDPDYAAKFFGALKELLQFDMGGRVNRDAVLDTVVSMLLPGYIGILRSPQAAAESERQDTDTVFARIYSGVGQDVQPGQAYGVRMERMQQILQTNPAAIERAKIDPKFVQDVQAYLQQLQQQLVQTQVNPAAGRLGSLPADYRAQNQSEV